MGIELLACYAIAVAAWLVARGHHRRKVRALLAPIAEDFDIALSVAQHEATSRGHALAPLHLLYGMMQIEDVTAAISAVGGDPAAIESRILDELDRSAATIDQRAAYEPIALARMIARQHGRPTTCADLWARLAATDAMQAIAPIAPVDVLFVLAHGHRPPALHTEPWVHVVARNDDFTTRETVVEVFHDLFELDPVRAEALMLEVHHNGRAVIGRWPGGVAATKIAAARARTRERGQPLWLGTEPC